MKIIYSFLIIITVSVSLIAQNNQEIFLQANLAYEQRNFDKALELYDKIPHKSSTVWYNMGNCCYQQKNYVDALVNWKRAQQQANNVQYATIEKNIEIVAKQQGIEHRSEGWLNRISQRFSLFTWQILFFLLWIFLCLVLPVIKRRKIFAFTGTLFGVLLTGTFLFLKSTHNARKIAIIKEDTPVYIGPSDRFAQQTVLKKAQEVIIKQKSNDWCKIQAAQKVGWISGEKIIEI